MTGVLAVCVAAGAAIGAPARYLTVHLVTGWGGRPSAGTLVVNVVGAFVLGLVAGARPSPWLGALVGVGFCGAFTTFSTLALELWQDLRERRWAAVAANLAATLGLGLGAVSLGWALTA